MSIAVPGFGRVLDLHSGDREARRPATKYDGLARHQWRQAVAEPHRKHLKRKQAWPPWPAAPPVDCRDTVGAEAAVGATLARRPARTSRDPPPRLLPRPPPRAPSCPAL